MVSRLPIDLRPAADEIAVSYLARLATVHGMAVEELWPQVSRARRPGAASRRLDGDLLAAVADQPRARLARALIELRDPEPDWLALRHEPQRGCWRCDAAHPGGPVLRLLGHHRYLCTRHRIWIGPPDQPEHRQPSLAELPEIVAAQHKHLRLLRRLGPAATFDAVLTGFLICAHRWNFTNDVEDSEDAVHHWQRRSAVLIPPGTELDTFSPSRIFAATYPEAVALAAVLGPLAWRRRAAGDVDQRAFAAQIGRCLGDREYSPRVLRDPVAHWIEQDCWQPPSLPNNDYRSLTTYGGASYRKPLKDAETRRRSSAGWFGLHRRGGDALLHHRALNPVVIRDWSTKMEQFTGTLSTSASTHFKTRQALNAKSPAELAAAAYLRPEPAPSTYLDTAVEPVPWARRPGPRPDPGARPRLPSDRVKGVVPLNQLRSARRRTR